MKWAALVPELSVLDLAKSLPFYTDRLGFEVVFSRPETRFAYLQLGDAQLLLDQHAEGQGWGTGRLEYPFGRGVNVQIEVAALEPNAFGESLISALRFTRRKLVPPKRRAAR